MNSGILKRAVLLFSITAGLLLLCGPVHGGFAPGSGLAGTPHDFSGISAGGVVTGLCTFCHTPHKAIEGLVYQNHTLATVTFHWCGKTETQYGTPFPVIPFTYQGPSKICLGCHSGTLAVGNINMFNGRSWTGSSTLDSRLGGGAATPDGCIHHPHSDHPTAFPYPYQGVVSSYNGVTNNASVISDLNPDPTASGIRLFREEAGNIVAGPAIGRAGIECSSCHDPHNGPTVGGSGFIRGQGSLCQKCHKSIF